LTEQQKTREIAVITQQLTVLGEQIKNANAKTHAHIEKRDKLNEQLKKLRREIQEFKNERNNLNEKVKTLKQHNQRIKELKKKTPRESRRELQKEFEDIEWKIQTIPLDMQEEKRLVENVKQLEMHLSIYKKMDLLVKKIAELRKELETLEANADKTHHKLTEIAERSQEIHSKMIAKISESTDIKGEADSLHSAYVQAKEHIRPLYEEFKRLTKHRKKLRDAVREEDEKRKKNAEKALKEEIESQARNKLNRGEKLSWDEFKLLADSESESV